MKKNALGLIALIIGYVYFGLNLILNIYTFVDSSSRKRIFDMIKIGGTPGVFRCILDIFITIVAFMWLYNITAGRFIFQAPIKVTIGYCILFLVYVLSSTFFNTKGNLVAETYKNHLPELISVGVILISWIVLASWENRKGEIAFFVLRILAFAYYIPDCIKMIISLFDGSVSVSLIEFVFGYLIRILGYAVIPFLCIYIVFPHAYDRKN